MIEDVKRIFLERIRDQYRDKPDELKFLLSHERKEICLNHLCAEIQKAERRLYKITFETAQYKHLIHAMTDFFATTALKHKGETLLTEGERYRRIKEASRYDDLLQEITEGDETITEI